MRKRLPLYLACMLLPLVLLQSFMYRANQMEFEEAKARTHEIAIRAARIRQYEFLRGVYAFCLASYNDPTGCNKAVAMAVELGVPSDPFYSFGFEPPQ